MAFIFWQNVASLHQRDLLRAIAFASGEEVVCAVENEMPADRAAFGWDAGDFAPVRLVRSNHRPTFEGLVARTDDTHVLTGFLHHRVITRAFSELSRSAARMVLHSESVDVHGAGGVLRIVRDRLKAARHRRCVKGVLAIGDSGVRYFEALGFEPRRIVPFGYFVHAGRPSGTSEGPPGGTFRIVYAGQLIRRKGLDVLFAALGRVGDRDWTLDLMGWGPDSEWLKRVATSAGIANKVRWNGPSRPHSVPARIAGAELLVLPSRWDGWGVVVNEALTVGVPVVCSDRCGAACVLNDPRLGGTFPVGDAEALAAILRRRIGSGCISNATRAVCRTAAASLSPESGARQFLEGIAALESGATPPPPPWRHGCRERTSKDEHGMQNL